MSLLRRMLRDGEQMPRLALRRLTQTRSAREVTRSAWARSARLHMLTTSPEVLLVGELARATRARSGGPPRRRRCQSRCSARAAVTSCNGVRVVRAGEPLDDRHRAARSLCRIPAPLPPGRARGEGPAPCPRPPTAAGDRARDLRRLVPATGRHQGVHPVLGERGRHEEQRAEPSARPARPRSRSPAPRPVGPRPTWRNARFPKQRTTALNASAATASEQALAQLGHSASRGLLDGRSRWRA